MNIKAPKVDRLAAELAARLHTNKTDAIRHALNAQLALLESNAGNREEQLLNVMRTEIWPLLTDRTPITKREREEILGYNAAMTIPAAREPGPLVILLRLRTVAKVDSINRPL